MAGRTITVPANNAGIISSDIRGQLQILENEISGTAPNANYIPVPGALSATGTPSSTTYLRGDGTWSTVPQGTVTAVSVATANGFSGSSSGGATPALTIVAGAITPTSVNGLTISSSTGTLAIANGKTATVNNSLTLAGTDSTTMTFPGTSATIARTDAANTFTGHQTIEGVTSTGATGTGNLVFSASPTLSGTLTVPQIVDAVNAITATSNAATVPITSRISNVTNNSAATLTITITTASAVDGQLLMVRIFDFSGVAQSLTWVNTENSSQSVPGTSNGSTTSPLTVGLQFNGSTSKWRCMVSV